jgi:putative phosphoesterase
MEYLTIFGDIHGNLAALQAVLKDMDARGAQNRYCLGDLVGYGTFPNEVIQVIRESGAPTIMGNYDQGIGSSSDECGCAYRDEVSKALGKRSIAWTNQHTTPQNKLFLQGLLENIPLQLGGLKVLLVHGSPRKINEYLYEDRPESSLERIMDQAGVDVLVCGHTHIPYHRVLSSGRQVINAGSVGKPKDHDPRACYVILEVEGRELNARFVRVEYDIEQTARAIEASEMPDEYAGMLRAGAG